MTSAGGDDARTQPENNLDAWIRKGANVAPARPSPAAAAPPGYHDRGYGQQGGYGGQQGYAPQAVPPPRYPAAPQPGPDLVPPPGPSPEARRAARIAMAALILAVLALAVAGIALWIAL